LCWENALKKSQLEHCNSEKRLVSESVSRVLKVSLGLSS